MPKKSLKRQRKQRGGENEELKLKTLYTTNQNYLEHNNFLFEFVNQILFKSDTKSIIQCYGVYKRLLDCVTEKKHIQIHAEAEAIPVEAEAIHAEAEAIPVEAESRYKYTKLFETDLNCVFSDSGKLGKTVSTKRKQNGHPELFIDLKILFINDNTDDILTDNSKKALNFASMHKYIEHTGNVDTTKDPFLSLETKYFDAMRKTFPLEFEKPPKPVGCFPWCPWGGTRNKRNKRNKRHKKTLRKK